MGDWSGSSQEPPSCHNECGCRSPLLFSPCASKVLYSAPVVLIVCAVTALCSLVLKLDVANTECNKTTTTIFILTHSLTMAKMASVHVDKTASS